MRTFEFDLILDAPEGFDTDAYLDAVEKPLFEAFGGDVTPGATAGVPYLACAVSAASREEAIARIVRIARGLGYAPRRVEEDVSDLAPA